MTDEEIRAICEAWGRGEHFPINELDEQQLARDIRSDPERWWRVLRAVIEESPDAEYGYSLSCVLVSLIKVRGRGCAADLVEEVRTSTKATAVLADALEALEFEEGDARVDPLEAYELFGRDLVVSTWLRHLEEAPDRDWDGWPYNLVIELIRRKPDEAWITITEMIEQAPLEHAELIGAGFLEDLLGGRLGDIWIERIEELAERSENFRAALAHLWIDGDVFPATFERIERAAGSPLARRRPTET